MRRTAVFAAVATCVTALGPSATPATAASGWTTVWSDSFSGKAHRAPSAKNWVYDLGSGWNAGQVQQYTNSRTNSYLDGKGHLVLRPVRDAAGRWTSARLESVRSDLRPAPGKKLRISARLQLPAGGQGYFPAFWALGASLRHGTADWPAAGEIDVMESVDDLPQTFGTLHCGVMPAGPCNEPNGLPGRHSPGAAPSSIGWHTYSVIWDSKANSLRFQVDGRTYHVVRAADVGAAVWQRTLNQGWFLVLNVAIGGGWPGAPDHTTVSGAPMLVDYVRVSTQ
jgi:beta-glucanase (GH16 family)